MYIIVSLKYILLKKLFIVLINFSLHVFMIHLKIKIVVEIKIFSKFDNSATSQRSHWTEERTTNEKY